MEKSEEMRLKQLLKDTMYHYGFQAQLEKTSEELDELDGALDYLWEKVRYGESPWMYKSEDDRYFMYIVLEEIADVYNMLDQIVEFMGVWEQVNQIRLAKMERTADRIAAEKISKE